MVTLAVLFGILAAVLLLIAALAPLLWAGAPSKLNLMAWGLFFLALYLLLGGGSLVVGG